MVEGDIHCQCVPWTFEAVDLFYLLRSFNCSASLVGVGGPLFNGRLYPFLGSMGNLTKD